MKRKLTEEWIGKINPAKLTGGKPDVIVWDEVQRGMGLRVSAQGKKTFILFYRDEHGKQRKPTLGEFGKVHPQIDLAEARDKAVGILAAKNDGHDPQARRDVPTLAEGFKMGRKLSRASDKTKDDYKERSDFFIDWIKKNYPVVLRWSDLKPSMLEAYILDLERQNKAHDTIRLRILPIKAVWARLHADYPDHVTPLPKIRMAKKPKTEIECLTPAQVAILLDWLKEWRPTLWPMATLQALCGLRTLEAANLRAEDCDLKHGTITVAATEAHTPKNEYSLRTIPICKEAKAALQWALDGGKDKVKIIRGPLFSNEAGNPWNVVGLSHIWRGVRNAISAKPIEGKRSNGRKITRHKDGLGLEVFENFQVHRLRSAFATMAGALGSKEQLLQAYMGHSPTSILMRHYQKVTLEQLQEIAVLMDGWRGLAKKDSEKRTAEGQN